MTTKPTITPIRSALSEMSMTLDPEPWGHRRLASLVASGVARITSTKIDFAPDGLRRRRARSERTTSKPTTLTPVRAASESDHPLIALRRRRALSIEALADVSGVDADRIHDIENDLYADVITWSECERLAGPLRFSPFTLHERSARWAMQYGPDHSQRLNVQVQRARLRERRQARRGQP